MKMTSIYPEFKDIESGEIRSSEIVNVNKTFCDKFIFIYNVINAILMFLLLIGIVVIVIITYA